MGERVKKKRAEESKAHKAQAKKTAELASELEDIPASQSKARNSKKPPSSSSAATRHSTRLRSSSSKLLESSEKYTSAEGDDNENIATRPKRSATAAANALLQQLQISETKSVDSEEDPDGKSNDDINAIIMVLISRWQYDSGIC